MKKVPWEKIKADTVSLVSCVRDMIDHTSHYSDDDIREMRRYAEATAIQLEELNDLPDPDDDC